MKTKHGIPCNEFHFTPANERDSITYQFVTDDGNTASSVTIRLGDTDPVTGEKLADLEFFRTYYRMVDKEIHSNLDCLRPEYTEEQKAWRKEEARRYREAFRKEYGYAPSRDDILWHLEQKEKNRYCLYYDGLVNVYGEPLTEYIPDFGRRDEDPFGTDLPDEVCELRELAETFTDRQKEVFDAMLTNSAGGKKRITNTELADERNVCEKAIRKSQENIIRKIRKKFGVH